MKTLNKTISKTILAIAIISSSSMAMASDYSDSISDETKQIQQTGKAVLDSQYGWSNATKGEFISDQVATGYIQSTCIDNNDFSSKCQDDAIEDLKNVKSKAASQSGAIIATELMVQDAKEADLSNIDLSGAKESYADLKHKKQIVKDIDIDLGTNEKLNDLKHKKEIVKNIDIDLTGKPEAIKGVVQGTVQDTTEAVQAVVGTARQNYADDKAANDKRLDQARQNYEEDKIAARDEITDAAAVHKANYAADKTTYANNTRASNDAITSNTNAINDLRSDFEALSEEVSERQAVTLSQTQAINAAHPMLVQGQISAIGVGVGYSDNTSSISVGYVQRITMNWSANANIAATTGSDYSEASAGAGVSYAW